MQARISSWRCARKWIRYGGEPTESDWRCLSLSSIAALSAGRSSTTVFQIVVKSIRSYACRSWFPIPRISLHGKPGQSRSASSPSRMAALLMICSLRSTAATAIGSDRNACKSARRELINHHDRVQDIAKPALGRGPKRQVATPDVPLRAPRSEAWHGPPSRP